MNSKSTESSIIYWSNQVLNTDTYKEPIDVFDGNLYKELLQNVCLDEVESGDMFPPFIDNLESTYTILKSFYNDYPNIINDSHYRDILVSDDVCKVDQLVHITELVIGVLLKRSETSINWMLDEVSNNEEAHKCLIKMIERMGSLLASNKLEKKFIKENTTQNDNQNQLKRLILELEEK